MSIRIKYVVASIVLVSDILYAGSVFSQSHIQTVCDVETVPSAITSWVKDNSRPLDLENINPAILRMFEGTKVISLGEETHGAAEMFETKVALIQNMIEDFDVRAVGLELNFAAGLAIDDYVMGGEGDPENLLRTADSWMFRTEHAVGLLRWIRAHNDDPKTINKVHVYGFDQLNFFGALGRGLDYLDRVSPGVAAQAREPFVHVIPLEVDDPVRRAAKFDDLADRHDRQQADLVVAAAEQVVELIDANRDALIEASTPDQWRIARQSAAVALNRARHHAHTRRWWTSRGSDAQVALQQGLRTGAPEMSAFFEAHDPQFLPRIASLLAFARAPRPDTFRSMEPWQRYEWENASAAIGSRLKVRQNGYQTVSREQLQRMQIIAADLEALLVDMREYASLPNDWSRDRRDEGLAQTASWIVDQVGETGRVVIWAHNEHVSERPADPGMGLMGRELTQRYGEGHLAVGLLFDQGSFRANLSPPPSDPNAPRQTIHTIGCAPAGSHEAMLRAGGPGPYLLDLRHIPASGAVHDWWATPHPQHYIGNAYNPDRAGNFFRQTILPDEFDLVVFIDRIRPAVAIPRPVVPPNAATTR